MSTVDPARTPKRHVRSLSLKYAHHEQWRCAPLDEPRRPQYVAFTSCCKQYVRRDEGALRFGPEPAGLAHLVRQRSRRSVAFSGTIEPRGFRLFLH